ncbi:signal peptidase I [candidate division WWE3 bacterium CG22_combo_CG10-13_8_21_14_all_39_12]|uniref:Signal peptidase I n=1 Tax=candidate division WWE3 bacterium CG22_combo_CG10-13_8_21_14_all_39_12 TaxID=1975094 RepID=A0A2H0BGT9_UNCKA|nr:MAG: signal peptidase I [candidate division WWE3 bacterium CG22_combo_CG10-13_8_21_14_all_39_12]
MKYLLIAKNIVYGFLIVSLVVIVSAFVFTKIDTPFSYRLFTVESGSMEPYILTGSVVFVSPQDTYEVQDVVTFNPSGSGKTVTHRIVEEQTDENLENKIYFTRGDANEQKDLNTLTADRIIGKVWARIPYVGYPVAFAQTQIGFILLIIIPATLIVYHELVTVKDEVVKVVHKRKEKNSEKESKAQKDEQT